MDKAKQALQQAQSAYAQASQAAQQRPRQPMPSSRVAQPPPPQAPRQPSPNQVAARSAYELERNNRQQGVQMQQSSAQARIEALQRQRETLLSRRLQDARNQQTTFSAIQNSQKRIQEEAFNSRKKQREEWLTPLQDR